jgi:hypothetical protein
VQGAGASVGARARARFRLTYMPSPQLSSSYGCPSSTFSLDQPTTNLASRRHVCQRPEQDRAQQPLEAEPFRDRDQHRQRKFSTARWHASAGLTIAQALTDLENNVPDLKSSLRPLQFVSAREVR